MDDGKWKANGTLAGFGHGQDSTIWNAWTWDVSVGRKQRRVREVSR
jgi:hypothetical protein